MYRNLNARALGISISQSETIEAALSNGFRGIDLDAVEFSQSVESDGLPKARRLIDSAKLKLGSFELPLSLTAEEEAFKSELERLPKIAELAAAVECRRATTVLQPASDRRPFHENFELHRRRLGEVGKVLEPFGIRLGVGFQGVASFRRDMPYEFIHNLDALLLLVGMTGRGNVGLTVDTWQCYVTGTTAQTLDKISRDQLVVITTADAPADVPRDALSEEQRLFPGETGVVPNVEMLEWARNLGYDGPVTPLAHPKRAAGVRRDEVVKLAGKYLDDLWKKAGLGTPAKRMVPTGR